MAYPVDFIVPIGDGQRSRLLAGVGLVAVKAILLLPHLIALLLFAIMIQVIVWVGFWAIAFTGRIPVWVYEFSEAFISWAGRATAWFTGTTDVYPTFGTNEEHPAQVDISLETAHRSRVLAILGIVLVRPLLALPHLFVLLWLTLGTLAVTWFGYVMVLINGELPIGVHRYLVQFQRWYVRVWAWIAALTDDYPPFSLS